MPGSEAIRLDPSAVATGRTELDITQYVALDGVDYGDGQVEQFMAERGGYGGAIPIDYRVPNRTVTMPLRLQARGTVSFAQIRSKLQSKAGLFQAEGGWLGRVTSGGGTVFADVVNAQLKLGGGFGQARGRYDENAELVLECLPDWYGDEVTLSTHDESSLPELVWTETGILGDYPGRVRLVVTDRQGVDQLGLIWGFRSRNYSSATTARLAYEAEALTPMDTAAVASLGGASGAGSNTMQHANLGTNWTPVMNTNLLAGTYLTHVGSYRVRARVYSTAPSSTVDVNLRFVWDVGDMTNPTENEAWTFPVASQFYMADLGEIRLDTTTGTHRWQGQIQAKGSSGGESVRIDRLFFQPLDESAGTLAVSQGFSPGLSAYSARDEFNQSAGSLTGKTLPVGGTWAAAAADTDDFTVETTGKTAQRATTSDTSSGAFNGRGAIAGTATPTSSFAQVDFKVSALPSGGSSGLNSGVLLRYTDLSNFLFISSSYQDSTDSQLLLISRAKAGAVDSRSIQIPLPALGEWYTVGGYVTDSGRVYAWVGRQGGAAFATLSYFSTDLATGGTLASGKVGFHDYNGSSTASTRNYDNFIAGVPVTDAVAFANQPVEVATEGTRRKDSTGTSYGPVSFPTGDDPRVPVSGVEARTVEGFVKASRGDFGELPDSAIDDIRAQVYYRPSWLYVPD